jgi:hypothetical protein
LFGRTMLLISFMASPCSLAGFNRHRQTDMPDAGVVQPRRLATLAPPLGPRDRRRWVCPLDDLPGGAVGAAGRAPRRASLSTKTSYMAPYSDNNVAILPFTMAGAGEPARDQGHVGPPLGRQFTPTFGLGSEIMGSTGFTNVRYVHHGNNNVVSWDPRPRLSKGRAVRRANFIIFFHLADRLRGVGAWGSALYSAPQPLRGIVDASCRSRGAARR